MRRVGVGTGSAGSLSSSVVRWRIGGRDSLRMPFHVAFIVQNYPACSASKYGSVTLGAAATREVALSSEASGTAIKRWPHHVLVTSSVSLTGTKTITITGADYYGRENTSTFVVTTGSGWYSPGDFSRIDYITVVDDGNNSGAVLNFGDAVPGATAACPMFSLPLPLIEGAFYNAFYRTSDKLEWTIASSVNQDTLPRDRPNGINRGAFRFGTTEGEPNGSMGYMVYYDALTMEGDPI